jgi:uncharacterized C2H2 Zn-finger protein
MAESILVGKWTAAAAGEAAEGAVKELQFYKDGSCLVPVALLGGDSETFPMYYFYQAFENQTIKFESGEPVPVIYLYSVDGAKLTLKSLSGQSFTFVKEEKKSVFKGAADVLPKKTQAMPVPEEPGDNEWKCPKCGKIHQKYVGTCGCGEPKPKEAGPYIPPQSVLDKIKEDNSPAPVEEPVEEKPAKKQAPPQPEVEPGENEWKCPACGKIHQKYVGTCGCGEPKPKEAGPYIPPKEVLDKIKEEANPAPVEEPAEKKSKKQAPPQPEVEPGDNEWKCPKCGKIHQKYVGTCGCGEPKPVEAGPYIPPKEVLDKIKDDGAPAPVVEEPKKGKKEAPAPAEVLPGDNEWKCPKCGKIHQKYVGTCGCGEPKPKEAGPYIPPQAVLDKLKDEKAPAPAVEEPVKGKKAAAAAAAPEIALGENEWKCPKCGKIHQKYVGTCGCGEPKPASAGAYIPPKA